MRTKEENNVDCKIKFNECEWCYLKQTKMANKRMKKHVNIVKASTQVKIILNDAKFVKFDFADEK